jgi:predicted cupin superfamily sugar epimerase
MSQDLTLLSSPASELVAKLELEEHFEGGFFKQTEAIQDGESSRVETAGSCSGLRFSMQAVI